MKDNINYEAPDDWGVSSEETWVSFEELIEHPRSGSVGSEDSRFVGHQHRQLQDK